ncbi:GGDEF domain-containing protein [Pseudomonas sp. R2.Fl]|nr:GGDEF domain-containing protein [Pseudomonas sp. R2.Fl]
MLDIKTAFLLWATQAGTLALLLAAVWLHDRRQWHYLSFGLGFAAHGLGVALVALRGEIPDVLSIQVANGVALSAFAFWGTALRQFDGKAGAPLALVPLLVWVAGNLVPSISGDFSHRVALFNAAAVIGFLTLSLIALTGGTSSRRYRRMLAGIWTIQSALGLVLVASALLNGPDAFDDLPYNAGAGLSSLVCFVAAVAVMTKMLMDRSEERLQKLVRTDPLTGVLNRRGFIEAFGGLRQRSASPLIAVVLFDLDHFKQINDRHGHQAGDGVLQAFCGLGVKLLPKDGAFGRTGGEEFAAVLPIERVKDAALYAEAIRHTLASSPVTAGEQEIAVTVSIGIAAVASENCDLDRLLSDADRALYEAKERGRNSTAIWNENRATRLDDELERAVDDRADRQVAVLRRLSAVADKSLER